MIKQWLNNLTDEYLLQWANKGLIRRGNKQLAKETPSDWLLDDSSASASIDSFSQQLKGVGFEQLSCSCPSPGPCFHLSCFLIGLKQRTEEDFSTTELTEQDDREQDEQKLSTKLATPWLIHDESKRFTLLGKASINKAVRWVHQGISADCEITDQQLLAHVDEKKRHTLIIPRQGGLDSAICSCKKHKCEHIAFAVLLQCQQHGITIEEAAASGLDDWQQRLLQQLKVWLAQLAIGGMNGVNRITLDQGVALATEIRQADMPRVGRQLMVVCKMLEEEYDRQLVSSPARLRKMIAIVYASVSGLLAKPMPLPYLQLAGEYRRHYSEAKNLRLIGICTDFWHSLNGYSGYTCYFFSPEERRFYTLSDARSQSQNPDWRAEEAFRDGELSSAPIKELISQEFYLARCWTSRDARISSKPETRMTNRAKFDVTDLTPFYTSTKAIANMFGRQPHQQPLLEPELKYHMTRVNSLSSLHHDRFEQVWIGDGLDADDQPFCILFSGTFQQKVLNQYRKLHSKACALFGSWQILDNQLAVTPIAIITQTAVISLTKKTHNYE